MLRHVLVLQNVLSHMATRLGSADERMKITEVTSPLPLSARPELVALARQFVLRKWRERAQERGHPEPPGDLSSACKFASLSHKGFSAVNYAGIGITNISCCRTVSESTSLSRHKISSLSRPQAAIPTGMTAGFGIIVSIGSRWRPANRA